MATKTLRNEKLSAQAGSGFVLDAAGREIMAGDVIKVEHFKTRHGRGWKTRWMYKVVQGKVTLGKDKTAPPNALRILHMGKDLTDGYYELLDGRKLDHVWIVQGYDYPNPNGFPRSFEERPRRIPTP